MAINYKVYYSTSTNGPWTQFGAAVASLTDVVTGLASSTAYYFQVIPVDSVTLVEGDPTIAGPFTTSVGIVEAVEGATVTTVGPVINASRTNGNASSGPFDTFVLVASATFPPFQISMNGGAVTGGDVVSLVYHNHTLFQHATDNTSFNDWWYWNTSSLVWTEFAITSLTLSNTTYSSGAVVGTVIGTLSTVMSNGSIFAGTYVLSDNVNFKIVGNALQAKITLGAGPFNLTITATPSVVGQAFTTGTLTISQTGTFASPPAQAVAAGFTTLAFFDDFTTNTVTGNASITTMQTGVNWYPGQPSAHNNLTDPANYHLMTTATAASISNGNTSGGSNASPSGGILQIFGSTDALNQGTLTAVPQALIGSSYTGPAGLFGPTGYWEGYMQRPSGSADHVAFWTLCIPWDTCLELDILEVGSSFSGNNNWFIVNLNEWNAGTEVFGPLSSNSTILSDSEWHTFGMLVKPTSGGQATITAYLDNVAVGSNTVGTGTGWSLALTYPRFFILGKDLSASSVNFDWVRYWGPSTFASKPSQVPAGWTQQFFDDFTSASTMTTNTGFSSVQTGINWYPYKNQTLTSSNFALHTTQTAAQVSNGNTGGGANASPNGGIMQMFGLAGVTNQVTFQGAPQPVFAAGNSASANLFGPEGYWEGYMQRSAAAPEHQSFWINCVTNAATADEVDIVEVGTSAFGNNNWAIGNINHWVNGVDVNAISCNATIASDSEWHTFGVLIKATSGGQGTMSAYLDNVLVGSVTVGTGTTWSTVLADSLGPAKRVWLIGKDLGTGVNSINMDWVRYWGP